MGPEWKGMIFGKSPRCADLIPTGTPGSLAAPLLEAAGVLPAALPDAFALGMAGRCLPHPL
eukprot:6083501-Lingulodinium_polyedra.AAC.1